MIRLARKTQLQPKEVMARAVKFFGNEGEQLEEKERTPCCISFEGSGGYVTISVVEKSKSRSVDVETREFEYQAKRFIQML